MSSPMIDPKKEKKVGAQEEDKSEPGNDNSESEVAEHEENKSEEGGSEEEDVLKDEDEAMPSPKIKPKKDKKLSAKEEDEENESEEPASEESGDEEAESENNESEEEEEDYSNSPKCCATCRCAEMTVQELMDACTTPEQHRLMIYQCKKKSHSMYYLVPIG